MPTRDGRPRIERRSPSEPAFFALKTETGLAFFPRGAITMNDADYVTYATLGECWPSPESWLAHQLFKRCGYSGMLRGS